MAVLGGCPQWTVVVRDGWPQRGFSAASAGRRRGASAGGATRGRGALRGAAGPGAGSLSLRGRAGQPRGGGREPGRGAGVGEPSPQPGRPGRWPVPAPAARSGSLVGQAPEARAFRCRFAASTSAPAQHPAGSLPALPRPGLQLERACPQSAIAAPTGLADLLGPGACRGRGRAHCRWAESLCPSRGPWPLALRARALPLTLAPTSGHWRPAVASGRGWSLSRPAPSRAGVRRRHRSSAERKNGCFGCLGVWILSLDRVVRDPARLSDYPRPSAPYRLNQPKPASPPHLSTPTASRASTESVPNPRRVESQQHSRSAAEPRTLAAHPSRA
ncbi:hypothetical protein HNR67_005307 [Crossiella cryophila]|uniref:Uncharacterized protein n=1 Tax=Crossiella cryophila TaxID=43355 RepID=A0A7W7CGR2_9PSEU|nr:hypothetical protein [Crossiella cryophila]